MYNKENSGLSLIQKKLTVDVSFWEVNLSIARI